MTTRKNPARDRTEELEDALEDVRERISDVLGEEEDDPEPAVNPPRYRNPRR